MSAARWPRRLRAARVALMASMMLASLPPPVQAEGRERLVEHPTFYRTTQIDGLSIFY